MEKIYLDLTDQKVRSIGVSNYSIGYLKMLLNQCKGIPFVNQFEAHRRLTRLELNKFCRAHDISYSLPTLYWVLMVLEMFSFYLLNNIKHFG